MHASLSEAAVLRVVASLVAAERARAGSGRAWDAADWTADTSVEEDGLALDSLELLAAAEVVGRFFRLHESGDETRLLGQGTLGGWSRLVMESFASGVDGFTFATSGTTGLPKLCRQTMATLHGEALFWAALFAGRTRIVASVPPHHIYGFLFTVLLPDIAGLPVLDARMLTADALRAALRPGDLLVGHPTGLAALQRTQAPLPRDLRVVAATSELGAALHRSLLEQGAAEVTDVYGSSETAGIARRTDPNAPFALLPRWQRGPVDTALTEIATGAQYALPDQVDWQGPRDLRPAARHDGAVQVAGINVFPARIAEALRGRAMVADCQVFLDTTLPEPRLRALLVPAPGCDPGEVVADCDRWCRRRFSAPERPVGFEVSTRLLPVE